MGSAKAGPIIFRPMMSCACKNSFAHLPVKIFSMTGRPTASEAAPYYFTYIDRIQDQNILHALESQMEETLPLLHRISEERSLHRYAPDKWSIRQMWNHVNDAERRSEEHTSELQSHS